MNTPAGGVAGEALEPSLLFDASRVTFGFVAPGDPAAVERYEAQGVPHLWVGGHVASPSGAPEVMMRLAQLSAWTERALIGTSVLLLPLYPPAIVAKQIADLDLATGGRVVLGVGIGGEHPEEFSACQVPVTERGARTNEAIPLIRRLWTGESIDNTGRFYPMTNVVMSRPARAGGPPIIVSGRQEAAMRRAVRMGDGWIPYLYSPRRYRASADTIRELAAGSGRDLGRFAWMAWVFTNVDTDGTKARHDLATTLGMTYRQDFDAMLDNVAAAGTVDEVVARYCEYVDAGVRHFVIAGLPGPHSEQLVFNEIIPRVREHAAALDGDRLP